MNVLRLLLYPIILASPSLAFAGNVTSGPTYAPGGHVIIPASRSPAPTQTFSAPRPAPAQTNIVPSTPIGSSSPGPTYAPGGHAVIPTLPQAPTATFSTAPTARPGNQPTAVQSSGAQLGAAARPAPTLSPGTTNFPSQSVGGQGGTPQIGQIPASTPGRLQLTPVTSSNGNGVPSNSAPTALSFNPNPNGQVLVTLSNGTQTFLSPQQAASQYGYHAPASSNSGYYTTPSGAVVNAPTGQLVSAPPPSTPGIPNTGTSTSNQPTTPLSLKPGSITSSALPPVGSSGIANSTPAITAGQSQHSASALSAGPLNSSAQYTPISQMSLSNYSAPVTPAYMKETCLATVYTMVERTLPGNQAVPINNFYNPLQGAELPSNLTPGPLSSNLTTLPNGSQLLVIGGTANTAAGAAVSHYMLGTSVSQVDGRKIITANDPYSGVQVKIDAASGQVINPPSGYAQINFTADSFQTLTVKSTP